MKKRLLVLLLLAVTSTTYAISLEEETQLIEKALREGAVTIEQKNAVSHYFQSIAAKKSDEAKKYREIAALSHGGKVASEESRKREFNRIAESLELEAAAYLKLAASHLSSLKEIASK